MFPVFSGQYVFLAQNRRFALQLLHARLLSAHLDDDVVDRSMIENDSRHRNRFDDLRKALVVLMMVSKAPEGIGWELQEWIQ